MTEPDIAAAVEPLASPEDVLAALSALLGAHCLKDEHGSVPQKNCPIEWSSIPWEPTENSTSELEDEEEGPDVDFSSFPSLSLERSQGEHFESVVGQREDVEAHVSNLLARPILVSNGAADEELLKEGGDEDGNELLEFMALSVSQVPNLMLQNFVNSFTTLMNSRLRAYATFLARHGLSLLENSPNSGKMEEGIAAVEQKLETMLEIGRSVSTNAIATSFQAIKGKSQTVTQEDSETYQVSMPLVMDAALDISLPNPTGGPDELVTVAFRANGTITGVFSKNASDKCLLRAAQVDIQVTSELLPSMIEEASSVISCIVEMTNAIYSLSLPTDMNRLEGETPKKDTLSGKRKDRAAVHVVEPDCVPVVVSPHLAPMRDPGLNSMEDFDLQDEHSALSPETLIDYVFHETDNSVLSPPSPQKKAKVDMTAAAADVMSLPAVPGMTQVN